MAGRPKHAAVLATALTWVGLFDLGLTILVLGFWLGVVQVADPATTIVLMIVRILGWLLLSRRALAPVRRWTALGQQADDAALIEADHALQRFDWRFAQIYVLTWEASMLASLLLGALGLPVVVTFSSAELATAATMLISLAACGLLMRELVRALLLPSVRAVAEQLLARRLDAPRPKSSVGHSMRATIVAIIMASLPGLMMNMGLVHIQGLRAEASMDQLRRAELAVATGAHADTRAVERDELPAVLREQLDPFDQLDQGATTLRGFDRPTNLAVAAVARDDGSWQLASSTVDEPLALLLAGVAFVCVVGLALGLMLNVALWRSQRELLHGLDDATRRVAEHGEIRAQARLVPLYNDEFGRLARNFNGVLDMLDELVTATTAVARGDLDVSLDRPGELQNAFRGMLEQLARVVAQLSETAVELATTAREIHAATREQELAGEQQQHSVRSVGAAMTTLTDAAAHIADEVAGVLDNAEHTLHATDAMADTITTLGRQTSGIAELLEAIREIADRSDLLALNGSLEATRAGEAGRGFALVATEMRRLAERVTGLVANVREHVSGIQSTNSTTAAVTDRSRELARHTATAARQIATVTQQQSGETEQLARTVDDIAASASAAAAAISQTRAAAEGLRVQAGRLEQLLGHFELGRGPSKS